MLVRKKSPFHTLCGVVLLGVLATSSTRGQRLSTARRKSSPLAQRRCPGGDARGSLAAGTLHLRSGEPLMAAPMRRPRRALSRGATKKRRISWDSRAAWIAREATSTPPFYARRNCFPVPLPR